LEIALNLVILVKIADIRSKPELLSPDGGENFLVVRGPGTWHCLPAGQPGHNGVPTPFFQ